MSSESEDQSALSNIDKHGCHILHVLEDESGPGFSYSIGIEKTSNQPELIVTGLNREISQWIINQYNDRARSGEIFIPKETYSGFLEGFEVQFRPMSKRHYKNYLGWGLWLYKGENFKVNQLIWPSTEGIWPWEKNASADYTYYHPMLFDTERSNGN